MIVNYRFNNYRSKHRIRFFNCCYFIPTVYLKSIEKHFNYTIIEKLNKYCFLNKRAEYFFCYDIF